MRPKLLLTTAVLSVALGAGGLATAQDRSSDDATRNRPTTQRPDATQNRPAQNQTTGQSPSSSQTQTAPQRTQPAPNAAQSTPSNQAQPSTAGSSPSGTTTQSGTTQPSTGQANQPTSAQTTQPPSTNQPSSAQTTQPPATNQPSSAQTAPSNQNQPSTATGSPSGQQQPSTAQQQPNQSGVNANRQAGSGGQAQGSVRLSASLQAPQRTKLNQAVARLDVRPVTNVNFSISVGTVIPRTVALRPVPAAIVEIIPQYRGYNFFVVRDEIVIVEPSSHRIVDVIERSGGSRAQTTSTTTQRKLNLSSQQKEIIRKHSQRRVTTTTGSAPRSQTRVVVGEEAPSTVEIESFPEEVYREVPEIRSYRYIRGDRGIYLVEPEGRRVIEDIE